MNTRWTCQVCKKIETTGPNVRELSHVHGGQIYPLEAFRKARKAPGKVSVSSLKAEVWTLFSEYIRRRDAHEDGTTTCVTCGRTARWQDLQAGHYISRTHAMILFDERNVHTQCPFCNGPKHGNILDYQDFMLNKYGQETVYELWRLANLQHKFSVHELNNLKAKYQGLLKEM